MIRFEHPLHERIRNFLRLEHLFERFENTSGREDVWSHHTALLTMFEIMDCAARAELKLDILQELERQRQSQQNNSAEDNSRLPAIASRVASVAQGLQDVHQKFGQHLRENEWLMAIKQRMNVAGGVSPLDLSIYHFWQHLPSAERQEQLLQWMQSLWPTYEAIRVLLAILRHQTVSVECVAQAGSYQQNSLGQKVVLLQIDVEHGQYVLPEVSANKYMTHIRFIDTDFQHARGKQVAMDVPFTLTMCSFEAW